MLPVVQKHLTWQRRRLRLPHRFETTQLLETVAPHTPSHFEEHVAQIASNPTELGANCVSFVASGPEDDAPSSNFRRKVGQGSLRESSLCATRSDSSMLRFVVDRTFSADSTRMGSGRRNQKL